MSEAGQQRQERSRDLERFITFVDAAVAIALTLLVLPLVDLVSEIHSENDSVASLVHDHFGQFYAFALSFVVISRLWLSHHSIMRPVIESDPWVVRWTFVWLILVVFLPFPTALVAPVGHQSTTKLLYIGTMAAASTSLALLTWSIKRRPEIREPEPNYQRHTISGSVTAGYFIVALGLALATHGSVGYAMLLILLLSGPTTALLERQRRH